ncbi:MAG TPA: ATP-binding cassette domain-containing protein [Feifaniaceae bacterium]|nr:ATP-binding cassette domain-containing protein [Feifaniaceae bacterium]
MKYELLQFRNVCMVEDDRRLLSGLNFQVFAGEIVGLIGLNDTGKSALVKLLMGEAEPTGGTILLENREYGAASVAQARQAGIYYVMRNSTMVDSLSVVENLCLMNGAVAGRRIFRRKSQGEYVSEILEKYGLGGLCKKSVLSLTPTEKYLLEIVKAGMNGGKLIILSDLFYVFDHEDSHTELIALCRKLKQEKISFMVIGNRFNSTLSVADRIIMLSRGRVARTLYQGGFNREEFDNYLFGNERFRRNAVRCRPDRVGEECFSIRGLRITDEQTLDVKAHCGEVLGVYDDGVLGDLICRLLFYGADLADGVYVNRKPVAARDYWNVFQAGIGLVPDQCNDVLFLDQDALGNMSVRCYDKACSHAGVISGRVMRYLLNEHKGKLEGIDLTCNASMLSYRQRFRLMMEMHKLVNWKIVVVKDPSLNYDPIETQAIYDYMNEMRENGLAVILITSDISELLSICNRGVIRDKQGHIKEIEEFSEIIEKNFLNMEL